MNRAGPRPSPRRVRTSLRPPPRREKGRIPTLGGAWSMRTRSSPAERVRMCPGRLEGVRRRQGEREDLVTRCAWGDVRPLEPCRCRTANTSPGKILKSCGRLKLTSVSKAFCQLWTHTHTHTHTHTPLIISITIILSRKRGHLKTFVVVVSICNIKFTILPFVSAQLSGIKYIRTVWQPFPLSISRTFSSSQTETLSP